MMSMRHSDIAILKIKSIDYRCIITGINKIEAINLMQNNNSTETNRNIIKKWKIIN